MWNWQGLGDLEGHVRHRSAGSSQFPSDEAIKIELQPSNFLSILTCQIFAVESFQHQLLYLLISTRRPQ